jgi:hypothetical protein
MTVRAFRGAKGDVDVKTNFLGFFLDSLSYTTFLQLSYHSSASGSTIPPRFQRLRSLK